MPHELWLSIGIIAFLFGVLFGSFGNVLIFRLPKSESIGGRSHCQHCRRTLSAWELIPVVSFLMLRGQCRTCHARISPQYPLIELASGGLFLFAFVHEHFQLLSGSLLALALWLLLLIAVIDARTQTIPDALNIPLLVVAVLLQFVTHSLAFSGLLVGAGFFGLQWLVSRGKWVGSGDIILGAGIGALLGTWQEGVIFLFFSYILGALVAVVMLSTHRKHLSDALPFGPFLVLGGYLTLIFGASLSSYLAF